MLTSMVHNGTLIPLNPALRPNSYLARSTTTDGKHTQTHTQTHAHPYSHITTRIRMMVYNDRNYGLFRCSQRASQ